MNDFEDDFKEVKEWYERADGLICSMNEDKLYNTMMIASYLRETYVQGKKDGVDEWNSAPRY